jgi:hypothetical protein
MKHKLWIHLSFSAACALCLIIYSTVGCPAQALAYGGGMGIVDPSLRNAGSSLNNGRLRRNGNTAEGRRGFHYGGRRPAARGSAINSL